MTLSITYPSQAVRDSRIETRALILIIWSATVFSYLVTSFRAGEMLSTDDAMRLVEVRDFLAGQGWFDLTQYRLSPPDGVPMHWSRLIDLPLAALIGALTPPLGPETRLHAFSSSALAAPATQASTRIDTAARRTKSSIRSRTMASEAPICRML